MAIWLKAMGIWLCLDGIISMVAVKDKRFLCQLGRVVRIVIGVVVFFLK